MKEEVKRRNTKGKSNKKKGKNNKEKIIYIVGGIILICYIAIFVIAGKPKDSRSIANEISNLFENSKLEEMGNDTEHDYSYVESFAVYTKEVAEDTIYDYDYAVRIYKFNSKNESTKAEEYIEDKYQILHKKIDGTFAEKLKESKEFFEDENDLIIVNGVYLIRIDSYYSDRYSELGKQINNIIKKYKTADKKETSFEEVSKYWDNKLSFYEKEFDNTYNELVISFDKLINDYITKIDSCIGDNCEKYLNDVLEYKDYEEVSDKVKLVQNKYDEVMNKKKELVNSINASISKVERSLNQEEFDNLKEEIDKITDSYYDEYKGNWLRELEKIKEKTFKNSCKSYNYKDVLRNPNEYYGNKAYWFGVVHQRVSSTQYRVGVDCTKYQYISGYSCKNTIYVNYFGDINLIEDDVVKMWGKMNGTKTYTAVLGNSITIPEFTAEYIVLQ